MFADNLFGLTFVILVRGVEEVAAGICESADDAPAFLFVGAESPGITEAHRPEANLRDADHTIPK